MGSRITEVILNARGVPFAYGSSEAFTDQNKETCFEMEMNDDSIGTLDWFDLASYIIDFTASWSEGTYLDEDDLMGEHYLDKHYYKIASLALEDVEV